MKKINSKLNEVGVIDLFCGVGGLTCGLKKAKLNVLAGYDFDLTCKFPYEYNNNTKFIHKDINNVKGKEIKDILKDYTIKVLVGCAPCQPFSNHQKDKANRSKHKEWGLLYQYERLINEVKPDIVSMENVPEITKEKVFEDFVNNLKEKKYYVNYYVVDAARYGVPQRRKRLILLASKYANIEIIKPTHDKPVVVRDVIKGLPPIKAGEQSKKDFLHKSNKLSELNLERIKNSKPGGTWRDWPKDLVLKCHKKKTGKTYSAVYGRMEWDKVSPTITTEFTCYGTGRFGHPTQNRALSLREGALLQTFPKEYEFVREKENVKMGDTARQIGNAVPPRLGEVIGESIIRHIKLMKF